MKARLIADANPSEERIDSRTREDRHLKRDNAGFRVFNESRPKLMKRVEGQVSEWRDSWMRQW